MSAFNFYVDHPLNCEHCLNDMNFVCSTQDSVGMHGQQLFAKSVAGPDH